MCARMRKRTCAQVRLRKVVDDKSRSQVLSDHFYCGISKGRFGLRRP